MDGLKPNNPMQKDKPLKWGFLLSKITIYENVYCLNNIQAIVYDKLYIY